jgi:alkanesulfonate monooxygenase SsuD/methylene tetrahydromethanopterin reductase-like flavin-dependent oxidoreductase (luciferase family)
MTDYGHKPIFGTFITPAARPPSHAVELAIIAEQAGLDLVTFQDHPYQPAFLDTWTLLSYVGARTERVRLSANVHNLPLRLPAVLARSAASLDLLTGGRFELGIGAGSFWDAIEAMGGRRLSQGEAVTALDEAIQIIRGIWAPKDRGILRVEGKYYRVNGAKRGSVPAHDIEVWIGATKPRMLNLTGRVGDGLIVSYGYLESGPAELDEINKHVDEGAASAGRAPEDIRRMLNIAGRFSSLGRSILNGPPNQWAEDLAELALSHGVGAFILATDEADEIKIFAAEVAPAVRELISAERIHTGRATA